MKHVKTLLIFTLLGCAISVMANPVDSLGVYRLTDGGGDPAIKSAEVFMSDVVFSDFERVNLTKSAGSGFFVSKGWPVLEEKYDPERYHSFTVTPQNGATLYIKKLSMSHKRSGSNPNPGNTVNFQCIVSIGDNEYVIGTGTTLNPTAWFHADNLKILTAAPVTFKFMAKDLYDDAQSWMQRQVSLIGAVIPEGIDPEDIIGPLEPSYTEEAGDYINCLQFFSFDAEGSLMKPVINSLSGMPLNYTVLVDESVDISDMKFRYVLPDNVTIADGTFPSDFSENNKQSVTLTSSWGIRKVNITVNQLKKAGGAFDLLFNSDNPSDGWNKNTTGWITFGTTLQATDVIQLASDKATMIVGSEKDLKSISYNISLSAANEFTGMLTVEASKDGREWIIIKTYNSCTPVPTTSTSGSIDLPEYTQYVRWMYDYQNKKQAVNLNNFSLKTYPTSTLETIPGQTIRLYPNPADKEIYIESEKEIAGLFIYDNSGKPVKKHTDSSAIIPVDTLPGGYYILKIQFNDQSTATTNFLKK